MGKINLKTVLVGVEDKPLKGTKNEDGTNSDLTLLEVCRGALLALDEKMSGEKKYENWKLVQKMEKAPEGLVTLKSEEITKLKELIGKYQFPIVVGLAWDLLESNSK